MKVQQVLRQKTSTNRSKHALRRRHLFRLLGAGAGYALARRIAPVEIHKVRAADNNPTLVVATSFLIHTLDPGRTIEITSLMACHAMYDTLVTFDGEDVRTPKPSLATSWKVSADGKNYTFSLRPNVKFASGNPMTSADVKWTLERVMNLHATTQFFVDGIQAVDAPDPGTVIISMKQPQPAIVAILAGPSLGILDSKLLTENGGDAGASASDKDKADTYLNTHSAGTGPFMLAGYTPNAALTMVKNPNSWRPSPSFDRIELRHIPEAETQKTLIQKGDVDIATDLGQEQIQSLKTAQGVVVKSSPLAAITYVQIDNSSDVGGLFANPKVQQAMRYALDYDGIMALAGPGAVRLAGLMPTIFPGAPNPRFAVKMDRAKAKALLQAAGLPEVRGRLTFFDRVQYGLQQGILAQKIQSDLSTVGISVELNGLPAPLAVQQWRAGKIQLASFGWTADYPDGSDYLIFLPGGNIGKRVHWLEDSSPEAKDLANLGQQAATETNPQKRAMLYEMAERKLADIGPYIPLYNPTVSFAYRANLRNVAWHSVWSVGLSTISRSGNP